MPTERESRAASHESRGSTATRILRALNSRLATLFGMPDYRRYLAHQHRCHPEAPVLTEKEFVRAEFERRYAGGGSRCC
ncbi:MAG TPA: YbdD/YjiX family protein [Gemmatimonadales bacterium]|nr:YbdD/YjiX family protein [Gemmatimonadales bacterium]